MASALTVRGQDVVLAKDDPGDKEVTLDCRRVKEVAVFVKYVKGDEDYIRVTPVGLHQNVSESLEFPILIPNVAGVPLEFVLFKWKFNDGDIGQVGLPLCQMGLLLKFKIEWVNLPPGGTEGTLLFGVIKNQL